MAESTVSGDEGTYNQVVCTAPQTGMVFDSEKNEGRGSTEEYSGTVWHVLRLCNRWEEQQMTLGTLLSRRSITHQMGSTRQD